MIWKSGGKQGTDFGYNYIVRFSVKFKKETAESYVSIFHQLNLDLLNRLVKYFIFNFVHSW